MPETEDRVAQHWSGGGRTSRVYDRTVKTRWLFSLMCRVFWGADLDVLYADVDRLATIGDLAVLDLPAGGGLAFRALRPDFRGRYVAADVSQPMLDIARAEAAKRGLGEAPIEYVATRADAMPFADASFDLCVSYNGLHCFTEPGPAVAEIARVLKPGGELRGTAVVRGSRYAMISIKNFQRHNTFADVMPAEELSTLLTASGFTDVVLDQRGAYCLFTARRAAG